VIAPTRLDLERPDELACGSGNHLHAEVPNRTKDVGSPVSSLPSLPAFSTPQTDVEIHLLFASTFYDYCGDVETDKWQARALIRRLLLML